MYGQGLFVCKADSVHRDLTCVGMVYMGIDSVSRWIVCLWRGVCRVRLCLWNLLL